MTTFIFAILVQLASPGGLSFRNLSMDQGLSNNTVSSICQDDRGMIWIATKGGVNRFDGYDTKVFRYDPDDDNSIQSNLVNYVYTDWNGTIWACTADGLARFDPETETFRRTDLPQSHSIESMTMVGSSQYILAESSSTILYDSALGTHSDLTLDGQPVRFYSSAAYADCLILGTTKARLEFLKFGQGTQPERVRPSIKIPSPAKCLLTGLDSCIWIGTNRGLLCYRMDSGTLTKVELKSLLSEKITDLEYDTAGNIWIGTKYGISLFDPDKGTDFLIEENPFDLSEPSDIGVRDLFRDRQGNIWVCYSNAGLDFVNANSKPFHIMHHCPGKKSISGDNVRSLAIDKEGNLWIGTRYNSLNSFNRSSGELTIYEGIPHILCTLCSDKDADLFYIGAYNDGTPDSEYRDGIIELNKRTGAMRKVSDKKDINDMVWADGGLIWVACLSGLYILNPVDGESSKIKLTDDGTLTRVQTVMVDREGHLWVGAKESLNEYVVGEDHTLEKITAPALNGIVRAQVLHEGLDGTIWIGTSDGLFLYKNGELERAGNDGLLEGRYINCIQTGPDSLLWIGTDNGLCRYDPVRKTGKFYYPSAGRKYSHFNLNASCIGSDGTIYMGSTRGVVYFKPSDIRDNSVSVKPRISGITVHNTEVNPGDGSGILTRSIDLTEHITIRHDQDAISLKFSCTDYASEGLNSFEYRLDPFDEEWMHASNREATYTNLRKGDYVFRVRAANSDGIYSEEEAVLGLTVKPAWYETTFAKVCFGLIVCSILFFFIKRLLGNARKKNEALLEDMRQKYETDMLKARLSSYTRDGYVLNAEEEAFLSGLIAKIEGRISEQGLSVEEIASDMCMSRSNLHLKVSALTGASTIDLIKRIRIEKACSYIKNTELSLTEIAEKAGFNSSTYFSSCFRKAMGLSPSAYLSKMRK